MEIGTMISQNFENRKDGVYSVEQWVYTRDGEVTRRETKTWLKYPGETVERILSRY